MSPVARRQGGGHTGRAVAVAIVGVAVALGVAFLVATLASTGDIEVNLGDDVFDAGDARDRLDRIERDGAPVGFNDPATGNRPIWLDNLGDDPETGWIAHLAVIPNSDDRCVVNWDADRDLYVSACDPSVTYPRSGEGLRSFPVAVDDGDIIVDLQAE